MSYNDKSIESEIELSINIKGRLKKKLRELTKNREMQVKAVILLVFTILIALDSNIGIFSKKKRDIDCFDDYLLTLTKGIAKFNRENEVFRNIYTVLCSLLIDIMFIYSGVRWIFFTKTWRLAALLIFFYGVRAFVQKFYIMGKTEEYFWKAPVIKSLMVSYLPCCDFFYSGHVAFPIMLALDYYEAKQNYIGSFCLFVSFLEMILVIITRAHYSIDIFTGLYMGIYQHFLVDYYEKSIMQIIEKRANKGNINENNNNSKKSKLISHDVEMTFENEIEDSSKTNTC